MADQDEDTKKPENSENSDNQNVSETENQTSEPTDSTGQTDSTDTPSPSESSEKAETPKVEESTPEEPKKAAKPVSKELEKIIEQIEKLSVLELADLVHALEDRFGVTATVPVGTGQAAPAGTAGSEPVEEQTTFNVILAAAGANKIGAIKAVRELVPTLGLKEAKDLVEAAPKPVLEGVNKETANEAKNKLTAAGATVELQ